jgi:hypothetical protein
MPTGKHEHAKSYDLKQLKKDILNNKLFGFVQVDIETPEDLKKYFSEMCPIFKNAEIKFEDIGEYMQNYHNENNIPFNKGKNKVYNGVPGNLVAFACKLSFQRGFQGAISFLSKSQLIDHYVKTLGAFHLSNRVMIIETKEALKLIGKYFPNSI